MTNNNSFAEKLPEIEAIVQQALAEDIRDGDVTSRATVPPDALFEGRFVAKESGVVAGLAVVGLTFAQLDWRVQFTPRIDDGQAVSAGDVIATISGPGYALLSGERVALNFLQRMSGIATTTRQFVEAVRDTSAVILDTRKTVPGLRLLDKWAVRLGGGQNHRFGLYDMVLIKENHITAAGGLREAVSGVRADNPQNLAIEIEVKHLDELREALDLAVDRILLDNMTPAQMREAVTLAGGRIPLEASGNVSPSTVAAIAATGVDYISIGMLTHSVRALDISLLLD